MRDRFLHVICILVALPISCIRCQGGNGANVSIKAVLNGTAWLPCDVKSKPEDKVILVVWYQNELKPIYSYDSRIRQSKSPTHWKDKFILGDRAHFRTLTDPAVLVINNVQETDEGNYRCRVDFMKSPTRNSRVNLMIIVPPGKPIILNEDHKILQSTAGPYIEGTDAKLTCKVVGGKPEPRIRWWREDKLLDSSEMMTDVNGVKFSEVILRNLNRTDLHKSVICQATNNNINGPSSTSVQLDIYFRPMNVSINDKNQPLSSNKEYRIMCQAIGSRPHSTIVWWKDTERLMNYTEEFSEDGNVTTSILIFKPELKDHNKSLICQANNARIDGAVIEDVSLIDVTFAPLLKLDLGANMNAADIEEGDHVYFECNVTANPQAYKVEWIHNGVLVQQNVKNGVIVNHPNALILRGVRRHMAGNYTCIASNVEGDGRSNTVQLQVMYKPVCRPNQKYIYGVAKEENAYVICEVDAFPAPDSFKWHFNHTTKPIPEARYTAVDNRKGISILTFSPQTELDYGILMCSAQNNVGLQTEPCIFHVIPAGQPETPKNCTVRNQTSDSVDIVCMEGFDGGQNQLFFVEVIDSETNGLLTNISSDKLTFKVGKLSAGKLLKINIFAANTRGKSEAVVIETFTLKSAQKHTGDPSKLKMAPVLGAVIGVLIMSLILGGIIRCAIRGRKSTSQIIFLNANGNLMDKAKSEMPCNRYDIEEKRPDVIQCNNKEYRPQCVNETDSSSTLTSAPRINSTDSTTSTEPLLHVQSSCSINPEEFNGSKCSSPKKRKKANPSISSTTNYKIIPNNCEPLQDKRSVKFSPLPAECTVTSIAPHHREVVTVRTPLHHNDQESCV